MVLRILNLCLTTQQTKLAVSKKISHRHYTGPLRGSSSPFSTLSWRGLNPIKPIMTQIGRMAHGRLNLTASTFNQLVAGATATQISPEVSKNEVSTYLTTETACKRIKPGCCIRTGITVIDLSADPTAYRWVCPRHSDTRPTVTFCTSKDHRHLVGTKLYCWVTWSRVNKIARDTREWLLSSVASLTLLEEQHAACSQLRLNLRYPRRAAEI